MTRPVTIGCRFFSELKEGDLFVADRYDTVYRREKDGWYSFDGTHSRHWARHWAETEVCWLVSNGPTDV